MNLCLTEAHEIKPSMKEALIEGYAQASDLTGVPIRTLRRLVAERRLRVIRHSQKSQVYFSPQNLWEDLKAMEVPKL